MKDSAQLSFETLTEALKLNKVAQQSLLEEAATRTEDRNKLVSALDTARAHTFDAIGIFSDVPTPTNKTRLHDFRQVEADSEHALVDFDLSNNFDDMDLLINAEKQLKSKLKNIRISEGADSLQIEFEALREQLKTDLPRLLILYSVINNMPPGIIDVERVLLTSLNFRHAFESGYQQLLQELNFEEETL